VTTVSYRLKTVSKLECENSISTCATDNLNSVLLELINLPVFV